MSQCEKKPMVIQGIKDRSEIREDEVIRKQGYGDEGETREAREGEQGRTLRWVSIGRRGVPGEIQGRSIDLRGSMFRGVGGSMGKGDEGRCWRREHGVGIRVRGGPGGGGGEGETRTIESGGVLGSQVRSIEGRWVSSGERQG